MELETINKLYLELSQVATAKTAIDLHAEKTLAIAGNLAILCVQLARCLPDDNATRRQALDYLSKNDLMPSLLLTSE